MIYYGIFEKNNRWMQELFTLQTEPSIGASHQSSAHLAKQFQRRRLLEIGQSETRIVCDDHVCQRIGMTCAILIEDLPKTVRNINRTRFLNLIRI